MKKPDLIHPLFCWDVYTMFKGDILPSEINKNHLKALKEFGHKYDWRVDLESILSSSYDALVLTDKNINIQWVSNEFEEMTGYSPALVLGKSPRILQGPKTTSSARARIKEKLTRGVSFAETVVNYRKNGEEYMCRVEIFPIEDAYGRIQNFLALETEMTG